MNLYIMSRGRAGKVRTINSISEAWLDYTYIVCSHGEYVDYRKAHPNIQVIEAPKQVTNYSEKFQWILDGGPEEMTNLTPEMEKAAIVDDDLVFSQFNADGKLLTLRVPEDTDSMWQLMADLLDEIPLVGVHPRQNAQNPHLGGKDHAENSRIICIQGVNRDKIGKVKVDQYPILADVVLNCTLLSRGQPNALITTHFQDHGPCQAPGGCSLYRTPDMQRDAVMYLERRWPGFVKVVTRHPKVAKWMGDTRYDYSCQWKKLYAAGAAHVLDPGKVPNPDKEASRVTEAVE